MDARGAVIVQGYTVLPVKFSSRSKACHHLYLKEHAVRESSSCKPKDRTLFVIGIPPYCDEPCIKRLFSACGKVVKVYFHNSPTIEPPPKNKTGFFLAGEPIKGFKVAYVVFRKAASIEQAKQLKFDQDYILSTEDHPVLTGVNKWCKQYSDEIVDPTNVQVEVDDFIRKFDEKLQKEVEDAKEKEGVADEDGWVTVTRHGKNKGAPRTEAQEKRVNTKEKKKRKEKELLNFYSFQVRESKMEHIATLRQKFEEDKQKIALMKQARKFRPY